MLVDDPRVPKSQDAEVTIPPRDRDEDPVIGVLRHDPAWAWLHDPAEDVYTEEDARTRPPQ